MYPASTTKIMTAILALENCELSDVATVSQNAIFSVPVTYTNANLQLDEELTIEQLLNILLIPSANDAANVIAEHIAGSVSSFASMMNTKAREIGCLNTNFVNANGVHDENHYSTAYDLALIGQYAMKNETIMNIVKTTKYTLPITNKYLKEDRIFTTTNKLINSKSNQYYEYATGLKTGYTDAAKNCIVATAEKNGSKLICVILGAKGDTPIETNKFADCTTLFNYGFNNYSNKTICEQNTVYKVINPKNASKDTNSLNVLYEDTIKVFVNNSYLDSDFSPEVELDENLSAPIEKGAIIGKISYTVDDTKYTTNLIAGQDIESNSIFSIIIKILVIIFALYLFSKILSSGNRSSKKKTYKNGKRKKSSKKGKYAYISPYKFEY